MDTPSYYNGVGSCDFLFKRSVVSAETGQSIKPELLRRVIRNFDGLFLN